MQRWIYVVLCVSSMAVPTLAGGTANTLTKEQAAEGWLLLFDGESTYGWDVDGDVVVQEGSLIVGGEKETTMVFRTPFQFFELELNSRTIRREKQSSPTPRISVFTDEIVKKTSDLDLSLVSHVGNTAEGHFFLTLEPKGGKPLLRRAATWERKKGKGIGIEFDPVELKTAIPRSVHIHVPKGTQVALSNVKLKPLGTKSLFDGKSLDGWKVLPGYKSKYTVTKEGWMNVKDGRGDIQTIDAFKNFVLQLDCISNGEHLNSGIFFRCLPNEYQQGYEAQIRNQFTPGEERVYKLSKYDPKTHESLGTYEVKSTAFDYGTGAIYRRMPARKGVAKDNEWFTLTVAAHDNHFATWVNGVQVCDWTDHRPMAENGRQGYCPNAGVISIQGHDPTTDLSFRNFRIADFE